MVPLRLTKMAARAKNRKTRKTTSSLKPMGRFQNNFTDIYLDDPLPKLLKWFRSAPELKNRKTRKTTSPPRPMGQFQNNFTEMFLG